MKRLLLLPFLCLMPAAQAVDCPASQEAFDAFLASNQLEYTNLQSSYGIDWRLKGEWEPCKSWTNGYPQWVKKGRGNITALECGKVKLLKSLRKGWEVVDSNGNYQNLVFVRHDTSEGVDPKDSRIYQCDWHDDGFWTRSEIFIDEIRKVEGTDIFVGIIHVVSQRFDPAPKPRFDF